MEFYGRVPLYHKNNLTRTHRKNQNIMLREEAMFLQSVAETFRLLYLKKKNSFLKQIFTNKNITIPQGVISQLFR